MQPTLVVLAAGMGSRYGGLKQLDPIGPDGSTVLDYSVYDAWRAGFGKVVFVIREDFSAAFRERVEPLLKNRLRAEYAFQTPNDLPGGFQPPPDRVKPWGTGHAIWSAREQVNEPFCVINADDFYGAGAFRALKQFFERALQGQALRCALVGYRLKQTLSDHGGVSRGVLDVTANGFLAGIREMTGIHMRDGTVVAKGDGNAVQLEPETLVSMNCWGFQPAIFDHFEKRLLRFLRERGNEPKAEFYVADPVESAIRSGIATFEVLPDEESWFGVTYREDRAHAVEAIQNLIAAGIYPETLWT